MSEKKFFFNSRPKVLVRNFSFSYYENKYSYLQKNFLLVFKHTMHTVLPEGTFLNKFSNSHGWEKNNIIKNYLGLHENEK